MKFLTVGEVVKNVRSKTIDVISCVKFEENGVSYHLKNENIDVNPSEVIKLYD